jgi:hypothetical protein
MLRVFLRRPNGAKCIVALRWLGLVHLTRRGKKCVPKLESRILMLNSRSWAAHSSPRSLAGQVPWFFPAWNSGVSRLWNMFERIDEELFMDSGTNQSYLGRWEDQLIQFNHISWRTCEELSHDCNSHIFIIWHDCFQAALWFMILDWMQVK